MGGVQSVMARAIPPLLQQGYSVTIAPGVPDDWTIASLAPGWQLQRFNPQAPVPQPLPAGGVALLIPADQRAIVDQIKQRYQVLAITRLTPGFDHGYTVAYVVRIRPFPTRARTWD
jgi:hypothetical protein